MGERNAPAIYPGRNQPSLRSPSARPPPAPYDPAEDDPLDTPLPAGTSVRSGSSGHHSPHTPSPYIVAPSIQVKPEFPTLTRSADPTQPLTCIVSIELPSRRTNHDVPGPVIEAAFSPRSPAPAPSPSPLHDHHAHAHAHARSDRSDATVTTRATPTPNPHRNSTDSLSSERKRSCSGCE
ncbi:hypothetical protein K439DRAFT_1615176 [Ramaria rubella]|nr:hypothetical protein K439DRAFT_1615176 [Ramaria rubella]